MASEQCYNVFMGYMNTSEQIHKSKLQVGLGEETFKRIKSYGDLEQSGQEKWPLPWQLGHAVDLTFDSSPQNDWYKSSTRLKLNGAPAFTDPTPLHFEHAIIFRSPHFLHIPRDLHIQESNTIDTDVRMYGHFSPFAYSDWKL